MAGTEKEVKGRRSIRYVCPVPFDICKGSITGEKVIKTRTHSTEEQIKSCQTAWLLSKGYKKLAPRAFESPEGPVLILSKKPVRSKPGKAGRYMSRTGRFRCM